MTCRIWIKDKGLNDMVATKWKAVEDLNKYKNTHDQVIAYLKNAELKKKACDDLLNAAKTMAANNHAEINQLCTEVSKLQFLL